jgi:hypothetical protein
MLHRRADVWERWSRIYGGQRLIADFYRLWAAQARFEAELFKALRAEQIVGWLNRRLVR